MPQKITLCSRWATKVHSTLYSSIIVLHSFSNFILFHYEDFLLANFFCSIWIIFCSRIFFVPFGNFLFHLEHFCSWFHATKNNNKASFRTFEHSSRSKNARKEQKNCSKLLKIARNWTEKVVSLTWQNYCLTFSRPCVAKLAIDDLLWSFWSCIAFS